MVDNLSRKIRVSDDLSQGFPQTTATLEEVSTSKTVAGDYQVRIRLGNLLILLSTKNGSRYIFTLQLYCENYVLCYEPGSDQAAKDWIAGKILLQVISC